MNYLVYILFGLLPSLIWLCFYLRKDTHPEPKGMIIKIFIYGMLVAPLAAVLQLTIRWLISPATLKELLLNLNQPNILSLVNLAIIAPITEEYCKYLVVKKRVLNNPNFDEPLDLMIYFVVAALGFAATENLLVFANLFGSSFPTIIGNVILRFVSATLVHVLASAMFGYFLALAFFESKKMAQYFYTGFLLAILAHAGYNYLIYLVWDAIKNQQTIIFIEILIILLLTFLSILVAWQFKELRKKISICKTSD